jgi:hypothetical protein
MMQWHVIAHDAGENVHQWIVEPRGTAFHCTVTVTSVGAVLANDLPHVFLVQDLGDLEQALAGGDPFLASHARALVERIRRETEMRQQANNQ